jgi:hypothetical protein
MSPGDYVGGLVAQVPAVMAGGGRAEHIAHLVASSAELSTLSRNIYRLTALLAQANVAPARPYREMLDTLAGDVRRHLVLAARALADLQPRHRAPHQHRHADPLGLRTRYQRGFQAAHLDRDEVMGRGVHEPTAGQPREGCEALVNLAAGRLSLHSPMHEVWARIDAFEPLDFGPNPAVDLGPNRSTLGQTESNRSETETHDSSRPAEPQGSSVLG